MRPSASSTERSSLASSRPADRPRRCGSTTVVCSTRTRVSCRSTTIVGRKLAGRALVDVGATSVVLRSRNSSACTITANRAPRCSCPRAPRRGGKRKISPRTTTRSGEARARPSARGSRASPRDLVRRRQVGEPRRGSLSVRDVGWPLLEGQCERPRNRSGRHHEQRRAQQKRCRPIEHGGSEPYPDCSTDRATLHQRRISMWCRVEAPSLPLSLAVPSPRHRQRLRRIFAGGTPRSRRRDLPSTIPAPAPPKAGR